MDKKETNMDNRNSGYYNSGGYNSGDYNSGYRNSGNHNSGNCNSGYRNSGYYNSGDYNSGYRNSGNHNSGGCNSGNYNSGNCNSGHRNSGFFNTDEPNIRLFNKDTTLKRKDIKLPYIDLKLTEWVPESEMTEDQKAADKNFNVKKGTLITRTYKEAWILYWSEASTEDKQMFLDLPNFDAEIFEEITGININKKDSCEGRVIEIDGKKYKLREVE